MLSFTVWSHERRTIVILPEENGLLAYHNDEAIFAVQDNIALMGQEMLDVLVHLESDLFKLELSNEFQEMYWRYERHLTQEEIEHFGIDLDNTIDDSVKDLYAIHDANLNDTLKDVEAITDSNDSKDSQSIPKDLLDDIQITSTLEDILPAKRVFVFVSDDFSNVPLPSLKRQRL